MGTRLEMRLRLCESLSMKNDLPYRPCVGVVLANAEGLVFVGERIDTPGAWQMPQGGIDKGETPADAALRELEEETGVPASMVAVEAEHPDWVLYDLPDHQEFSRWRWAAPDEVLRDIVPFKRSVYDQVMGGFRNRLSGA